MAQRIVDDQMRAYYERRAPEYDDWWHGTGLFAARDRPGWFDEVRQLVDLLERLPPTRVLDVACGTGFLTQHLQGELTALDQSARMVEITGQRVPRARVVQGDAVPLPFADGAFDRVFTSHFYGHLLPRERAAFLAEARRVAPDLVIVDSSRREDTPGDAWQQRLLNDGSMHRVFKRFLRGSELVDELGGGEVLYDGHWFVAVRA